MPTDIRVLIADDHPLVREGIRQALTNQPGFVVVAEAATGREAISLAVAEVPDVAILDISMPDLGGLEAVPELRKLLPTIRVLILSVHDHTEYVLESVRVGAHGYLRKDTLPEALRDAVRAIHAGGTRFDLRPPVDEGPAPPVAEAVERVGALTAREREVLLGIASGGSNKEIASRLGLSTRTVESYRENLMRKLGIHTVAELTRVAMHAALDSNSC